MLTARSVPRPAVRRRTEPWAALVAVAAAGLAVSFGWRGADLPAQIYRVNLFRSYGFLTYDTYWYGGHNLVTYSVLSPILGSIFGLRLVATASAVASAIAFGRLLDRHLPAGARAGTLVFAVGVAVPVVVGQVTFLGGLAFGLWALVAVDRGKRSVGALLALAGTLTSPLVGLFGVLAFCSWAIADRRHRRALIAVAAVAAAPLALSVAVFPSGGVYAFPIQQLAAVLTCALVGWAVVPARLRPLRTGLLLYGVLGVGLFVVANPVGGNLVRLGSYVAAALVTAVCWPDRRRLLLIVLVPALVWQWSTGVVAMADSRGDPSRSAAYFTPLLKRLGGLPGPTRIEIPFTLEHWETAYVAPAIPIARGWERQTDEANNPLFYDGQPLTAEAYRSWLLQNGVTWVALPDVPLDASGRAEAALIRAGQPFLRPVWRNAHWQLFSVDDSPGLLTGAASLQVLSPSRFQVTPSRPGTSVVRFRFTSTWRVTSGNGCVKPTADGWTLVLARTVQPVIVEAKAFGASEPCDAEPGSSEPPP